METIGMSQGEGEEEKREKREKRGKREEGEGGRGRGRKGKREGGVSFLVLSTGDFFHYFVYVLTKHG